MQPENIMRSKSVNWFPVIMLILGNMWPVIGILYQDWNISSILAFYWVETVIIGLYNFVKILLAKGNFAGLPESKLMPESKFNGYGNIFIAIFFLIHFGGFAYGHGFFLLHFMQSGILPQADLNWQVLLIPALLIFISHGISFITNYIGNEEYKNVSAAQQMNKPYGRVVAMHLTIFALVFSVMLFYTAIGGAIFLIAIKTIIDIIAHIREHKGYQYSTI